jgi:hypothetical protein
MSEHFNGLSPAQDERLAMLAEECAEVVQIVCKIQRHGYASHHPDDETQARNGELLVREITDLLAVLTMMKRQMDFRAITDVEIENAERKKLRFAHHQ